MKELIKFAEQFIRDNPELKDEAYDLVQLCMDEIEGGGSKEHEIELCYESIKQLKE